jgi:hypothetical protein
MFNRVSEFINNGVPMNKEFRMVHLKAFVDVVLKFNGHQVGHYQI